jgi:hypothetical protein
MIRVVRRLVGLTVLAVLVLGASASAQEITRPPAEPKPGGPAREHWEIRYGAVYDQGDYGTGDTTRSVYAPFTLKYLGEKFDIGLTVPWVYISTAENVTFVEGESIPARGRGRDRQPTSRQQRGEEDSAAGLGDIVLKGWYYLLDDPGLDAPWPSLRPFAQVKLPTADEDRNLGTGETDFGLGVEFEKQFGAWFLLGDVGYTFVGGDDFRDRPGAGIGAGVDVSRSVTLMAALNWKGAVASGRDDSVELVGSSVIRLGKSTRFMPSLIIGLTDGSPDFGAGFEISHRF